MWLIALRFLIHDRAKALGALSGVVLATFLVAQQTGTFLFLTGLMTSIVDGAEAGLWITAPETANANQLRPFDARRMWAVASVPGVHRVRPMVVGSSSARFADGTATAVVLVGSDPPDFPAGPRSFTAGTRADLLREGAVTIDVFERDNLGGSRRGDAFELGGRRAVVGAEVRGSRGFGGIYLFTTTERARAHGGAPPGQVSAVLVELTEGADTAAVQASIEATVPGVRAWRPGELAAATRRTVLATSGIGFSVGALIFFAVLAGFVTVGLTMYSGALDRIRDYGTMKAIGATTADVAGILMRQAALHAGVGFLIGMLLTEVFRRGVARTGVVFSFSPLIVASFFAVVLGIALGGSLLAVRRLARLEPATVFRG
jgi:putative ABC transport system permease protein